MATKSRPPGATTVLVCETQRPQLSQFTEADAAFIVGLLNEPAFIQHISDKGVRTLDDAVVFLRNGPMAGVSLNGFAMNRVDRKDTGAAIGMCGLIKRPNFDDVDIGYAFLPEHGPQGFAIEAARGVLETAYSG
jgi:ribosomal-protein-alanine N-acetyltransferase